MSPDYAFSASGGGSCKLAAARSQAGSSAAHQYSILRSPCLHACRSGRTRRYVDDSISLETRRTAAFFLPAHGGNRHAAGSQLANKTPTSRLLSLSSSGEEESLSLASGCFQAQRAPRKRGCTGGGIVGAIGDGVGGEGEGAAGCPLRNAQPEGKKVATLRGLPPGKRRAPKRVSEEGEAGLRRTALVFPPAGAWRGSGPPRLNE